MRRRQAGFTLLEILVATTIMGVAVVGLLSSLSTSMRNAAHISDADRIAQMARNKMEELLVEPNLPYQGTFQGTFDGNSGWTAQVSPFEAPQTHPGALMLQRIALVVWWKNGANTREYPLEAYRMAEIPRPAP